MISPDLHFVYKNEGFSIKKRCFSKDIFNNLGGSLSRINQPEITLKILWILIKIRSQPAAKTGFIHLINHHLFSTILIG